MTYPTKANQTKLFQRFGDLKVILTDLDWHGWVLCECRCGKLRSVTERKLVAGEITACAGYTARQKMEKPIQKFNGAAEAEAAGFTPAKNCKQ